MRNFRFPAQRWSAIDCKDALSKDRGAVLDDVGAYIIHTSSQSCTPTLTNKLHAQPHTSPHAESIVKTKKHGTGTNYPLLPAHMGRVDANHHCATNMQYRTSCSVPGAPFCCMFTCVLCVWHRHFIFQQRLIWRSLWSVQVYIKFQERSCLLCSALALIESRIE